MSKKIGVLAEQYFLIDSKTNEDILHGGGEKYFYNFVELLKKLGYEPQCYQFSTKPWTRRYKHLVVHGLGNVSNTNTALYTDYINGLNEFNKLTSNCECTFMLSMNLAMITPIKPTLTISHGLVLDNKKSVAQSIQSLDMFRKWVKNCTNIISVDTNSIHVMQVYDYDLAQKFVYIPNYYDENKFKPSDTWNTTGKFRVLYSRRLQECRGYHIFASAIGYLINKYPNMDFIFCGKGMPTEMNHFMSWYNLQDKNRVKYTWSEMDNMPNIYRDAEISIVPTLYAEGTSLSAIESLSSGLPLVSTYTGGLSDICQNFINGLLIKPDDVNSLVEAIEYMYNNPEHLKEMRENGLRTVKAFSKSRWDSQITKIIKQTFGEP